MPKTPKNRRIFEAEKYLKNFAKKRKKCLTVLVNGGIIVGRLKKGVHADLEN